MNHAEQTLKINDTKNGTIEFIRKRRNDVPLVIEIDPFTDFTRHVIVPPETLDELIKLLCAARGDFCECTNSPDASPVPKQERRCLTCHKTLIEGGA